MDHHRRELGGRSMSGQGASLALLLVLMSGLGCYQPKVQPGGLKCGPASKPCPDDFACVDDVCQPRNVVGGGGAGGSADNTGGISGGTAGAGGSPSCADSIAPLCATTSISAACDPVCQTGCACGLRCTVLAAGLGCVVPAGAKALGQVCQPAADTCAPGLVCLPETCGINLGRCRRFCRDASVCNTGGGCATQVPSPNLTPSGQRACDLGDQECDPRAATGCPDPALHCYVTGPSHTTCDCPSSPGAEKQEGDACSAYNDCAVGLACIQASGPSRCMRLCQSTAECPTCSVFGSVKYCALAAAN
jgi:hypothetical protein